MSECTCDGPGEMHRNSECPIHGIDATMEAMGFTRAPVPRPAAAPGMSVERLRELSRRFGGMEAVPPSDPIYQNGLELVAEVRAGRAREDALCVTNERLIDAYSRLEARLAAAEMRADAAEARLRLISPAGDDDWIRRMESRCGGSLRAAPARPDDEAHLDKQGDGDAMAERGAVEIEYPLKRKPDSTGRTGWWNDGWNSALAHCRDARATARLSREPAATLTLTPEEREGLTLLKYDLDRWGREQDMWPSHRNTAELIERCRSTLAALNRAATGAGESKT